MGIVFGELPEAFPTSGILQAVFFLAPVIGLVVIIETLVDLAMLVRDRRRNERSWCSMMASSMSDHIILVGLGRLGYRTFLLLRRMGEAVVVIERDANGEFLEDVRSDGSPLLIGDARRESLLEEANLKKAKSIILATNDDLANLEVALDARNIAPGIRVVMRMFDQNMADKIREGFNIHIAMSQSAMAAPSFATAAIDRSIVNSFVVEDKLIVLQRWVVEPDGPFRGITVGDVMRRHGLGVVKRRPRDGEINLFPSPETRIEEGDSLLVQGPFDVLAELRRKTAAANARDA